MIDHIRDYKIVKKIGEGGMGTVYLADDTMLERKVAIKVLNPLLTKDAHFTERFRQEAKVQASLVHPNIVSLFNYFQEDENYCMIMEFADGETLKHMISSKGPIPEQRAIWILSQMLEAVGFAHKRGIIHRDIKPGNILLTKDDTVKILDFGIAKILQDKGITKTGTKMGTIYYMSPEQIKAVKDIDHRTDIYSIGVTFYEMLSGRVPFNVDTDSDFEIMNEIVQGEILDPRKIYPHISDWIVNLLFNSVEKERDKRIQSAEEFVQGLLAKGGMKENNGVSDSTVVEAPTQTDVSSTLPPQAPTDIRSLKPQTVLPKVQPPVTPVKQIKKKSSAGKFVLIGTIGAAVIAVLVYFLFINEPSSENLWVGEEPWILNPNYRYDVGPAKRDFDKDDPTLDKTANWQASAKKKIAAWI
ncbi:MAG: serine/threonine protein kinase [Ignavibacteria bacterium]|nr:serine/threonine protein kinase [Ignavibacteria bacterium]MBT8382743.1 serine/threonine protein kinase [Ignavibacteria bacterium]MBT8392952.1 serine/threonine protein kinase [Ignavibacteria bacterium]NNJ53893.1 serine/threonine protein kinase [Ignavibacteriaceae bacterium]NNL19739.1 serine/threonine protein kinase [Ignavibacteriaceae bacterium]